MIPGVITSSLPALLWLDDVQAQDISSVGGKAAPLARLSAAGLRVPSGFVVPAAVYQGMIAPLRERLEALIGDAGSEVFSTATLADESASAGQGWPSGQQQIRLDTDVAPSANPSALDRASTQIQSLILKQPLAPSFVESLQVAAVALLSVGNGLPGGDAALAVRSSATAEDLPGASFAGQYDTILGVRTDDALLDAVRRCWTSYWSARAISYRNEHHLDHWQGAMAVLVQQLVPADCAGVAFTADPESGHRYLALVNAALGLGQGVVDGSVPADAYAVDKGLRQIVHRHVRLKTERIAPRAEGGTHNVAVGEAAAAVPALTDDQLLELAEVAVKIERMAGVPQDIEWAFAGGQFYILQSRAVTALPPDPAETFPVSWHDLQERTWHWKLHDYWRKPRRPLEADLLERFPHRHEAALITAREQVSQFRVFNSYVYVAERPSPLSHEERARREGEIQTLTDKAWEAGMGLAQAEYLPEILANNQRLLAFDRERATHAQLANHLEDAGRVYHRHWTIHWLWPKKGWKEYWQEIYKELTGDDSAHDTDALFEGIPNKLIDSIDMLIGLAEIAQRHTELRRAMEEQESETFLSALGFSNSGRVPDTRPRVARPRLRPGTSPSPTSFERPLAQTSGAVEFRAALDFLFQEQGLRSGAGFGADTNPLTPGWLEEPWLIIDIVRKYLSQDLGRLRGVRQEIDQRREAAVAAARAKVGDDPEKLARFDRAYATASYASRWFEDHNYYIDSAAQSLHRMALAAAARRLVARDSLDGPEDILWLRLDEITAALRAQRKPRLHPLVRQRHEEFDRWQAVTPPPWLGAPPPPPDPKKEAEQRKYYGTREPGQAPDVDQERLLVRGESGSRGVATGRVRIIPTHVPVPDVGTGDVLVAHNAGPIWTPVFPTVAAIVLDEGVRFQHAMLTAREYQVPAVFQTKEATKVLQEGQLVTVDGTNGVVLRPEE